MPRWMHILALSVLFTSLPTGAEARVIEEHIYLVPAGKVDKKILEEIKKNLPDSLPVTLRIVVEEPLDLPQDAYDTSRNQYDARMALDDMSEKIVINIQTESALFITDADLYTPKLNFVFGLADPKRKTSIISLARLKNEFYNLKPDHRLLVKRAVKETVHELGHSWGLEHCSNPKCVMFFSNSLADTDKKKSTFCHACHNKVRARYDAPFFNVPLDF